MVIWSPGALTDLREIWDHIAIDSEGAANRVIARLTEASEVLNRFANIGRGGRRAGTRELVVSNLPYFLEYRVTKTNVEISRVIHAARDWPPKR
jgi:toxin ParE1/3/4